MGACDATDGGVAQLNQMAGCEITAVEGVVGDQIHILTDQPPIHHHHRQALEPVELVEHLLLAFATHDQQAIDPLAQHHLEVGEGRLGLPLGVAQHQVVALLEAVTLHPAHHLGKEGVTGGGDQHADTVGLLHLEAAGHQTRGIVEIAHGRKDPFAGLLGHETGLVDDVGYGGGGDPRQRRHLLDIGHQCPCAVCSSRKVSTSCLLGMEL